MKNSVSISRIEDLKKYFRSSIFLSYPSSVEINIPSFSESERTAYKKKIESYISECGCESGQHSIYYSVTIYIILSLLGIKVPTEYHLLNIIIFIFFGATTGKLLGLIKARIRLHRIIIEIESRLK